jgi:hypothetical protein
MRRMAAVADEVRACIASLRRIARNIKRWKGEGMICRWVALGVAEAQRGFRRVKGHKDKPALVAALRPRCEDRGAYQEGRVSSRSHRRRCYAKFNARRGVPPHVSVLGYVPGTAALTPAEIVRLPPGSVRWRLKVEKAGQSIR